MKVKDLSYIFSPGDYVEVADGELVNLRGRVQSVDGEKIVMLPDHEDLKVLFRSTKSINETVKLYYLFDIRLLKELKKSCE